MRDREHEETAEIKKRRAHKDIKTKPDRSEILDALTPDREPNAQLTSLSPLAHAQMLKRDSRTSLARTQQSLLQLQRQCGNRYVQREVASAGKGDCEAEVTPEVEQAIERKRGHGQPLNPEVRSQMEAAFGADFSAVRVHTDADADKLNRALNARAFTTANDIFFKNETYSAKSPSGRELLAHELTHVLQQTGHGVQRKLPMSRSGDKYEQDADKLGRVVSRLKLPAIKLNGDLERLYREPMKGARGLIQAARETETLKKPEAPSSLRFYVGEDDLDRLLAQALSPEPTRKIEEKETPKLPERLSLFTLSSPWDIGLRFSLPKLEPQASPDSREAAFQAALSGAEMREVRFKSALETLVGKVPTGLEAIDKDKLAKAMWHFGAENIFPDLARDLSKRLSGTAKYGGLSLELDFLIFLDKEGSGLSLTVKYGVLSELFQSVFGR